MIAIAKVFQSMRWLILLLVAATIAACGPAGPGVAEIISPDDYVAQFRETGQQHILVDVRTPSEFASGFINGAVNIPVQELAGRLDELPENAIVVVYCRSGNRSAQASQILSEAGYSSIYDLGGTIQWTAAGYGLE